MLPDVAVCIAVLCIIRVLQVALSELLFVADNLAYFSYQQLDEPLFVMKEIDVIVTMSGSVVLDMFTEVTPLAIAVQIYDYCYFY